MIFQLSKQSKDSFARSGTLSLNGVEVQTPIFMPVGTRATVKTITSEELAEIGYELILANTYHLYLRPGVEVLDSFRGVKNFMSYKKAMLTDSGGYQVFSLNGLFKFHKDGVKFSSHIDGSKHEFTPEKVIDIQRSIGSDIMMVLDDCAPYGADRARLETSLERTHYWAEKSISHWEKNKGIQNLFGISQGGTDLELRLKSLQYIQSLPFSGIAIGGLSVGEPRPEFIKIIEHLAPYQDPDRARYLMGVGTVPDILDGVKNGIDMFDCVLPTRNARNGQVFTSKGKVNLRNESLRFQEKPMDTDCNCKVCRNYSVGYIRHLHKVKEFLAFSLSTYHNLYFMKNFMLKLRASIEEDKFTEFYTEWKKIFK